MPMFYYTPYIGTLVEFMFGLIFTSFNALEKSGQSTFLGNADEFQASIEPKSGNLSEDLLTYGWVIGGFGVTTFKP